MSDRTSMVGVSWERMTSRGCARKDICIGDAEAFAKEMIALINAKEYSDIRFLVGEERQVIYAHRCLLDARCEVFRAMFTLQKKEELPNPLVLSDVRPKTFLSLLEYIYSNSCSLSSDFVVDVLSLSVEYGLDGLTRLCVRFMKDSMQTDNVCEFFQGAITYNQTTLRENCLAYIELHTKDVFSSSGFNELSEDALAAILTSDKLMMDETHILSNVTEWITVNSVVSGCSMCDVAGKVIHNVRFPLLDLETLNQVEEENKKKGYIPLSLIAGAWKFHALKSIDPNESQTCPRAGTKFQER